ncbi:MAG: hypothetical protein AAF366_04045 [Pseudomonadota bacterium]
MTDIRRQLLLLLAETYLRLGRPRRTLLLLVPLARGDLDVHLRRLALRAYLAIGDNARALDQVDHLVEHEFSSDELAFTLAAQSRALAGLGETAAARTAWAECVAICRTAGLSPMDYAP